MIGQYLSNTNEIGTIHILQKYFAMRIILGFFALLRPKSKMENKALFSSKKFWEIDTVALSFVFDKYCLIMD